MNTLLDVDIATVGAELQKHFSIFWSPIFIYSFSLAHRMWPALYYNLLFIKSIEYISILMDEIRMLAELWVN